jgi:CUG-BP- and ETR3-like factor
VFHIPNDMTNLDLYQMFSTFGQVISARIMVDKVTGRSRGFGAFPCRMTPP